MESNLFMALRMEQNEVVMCRFLADLLDPKGWHKRKTQFLKSFLRDVVQLKDVEKARLENTCVMTEYRIDNDRRIDIMLQNPAFSVPIEAKINAGDQESQCYDYFPYVRNAKLVYLTKWGDAPSEWSRKETNGKGKEIPKEELCCISWKDICIWLEKESGTLEPVRQYTEAIRSFLPKLEKRHSDCGLVCDVLTAFRREMGQGLADRYGLVELPHSYKSYQDWEKIQGLSFCPGLNYRVQDANFSDSQQMWFRIEVADDGYLSAGFCLVNVKAGEYGKKAKTKDFAVEELYRQFDQFRFILSRDGWWFVWRFSNGKQGVFQDDVPNFKTMNLCAANLRCPKKQAEFVTETIQIFKDQLLEYLTISRKKSND
ncbi:MAG: PD-(D/E)XK nuclease family protein [Oscillibacter sp.]|nr:PD-(D/E)XK nuclease family protein [Oscillibacter sp.]